MPLERACNVDEMVRRLQAIDRRLVESSPHRALLFRERMQRVIAEAPRIGPNAAHGVFATETVESILREASTLLSALHMEEHA